MIRSSLAQYRGSIVVALGAYAAVGGFGSFLGYVLDIPRLTDWHNSGISIQPNAALCVTFSGLALALIAANRPRLAAASATLVLLIGGSTLLEWITGLSFGHDGLLLFGREWGRAGVVVPGRMGPPGSFSWTLIGTALLLTALPMGPRWRRIAPALALITTGISAVSLAGYLYGADPLFTIPKLTVIAMQTSTFIMSISLGIIASHPDREPMRMLIDAGSAGILARRIVPVLVIVALGLGFLRVTSHRAGLLDVGTGVAMMSLLLIALLATPLWLVLGALRRREHALRDSEARHRTLVDAAVYGIITIDEQGTIETANPAAERLFGYSRSELAGQNVSMLMPEPYRSQHNSYLSNYLRTGEAKIIGIGREVVGRRKDGSTFPMDLAVAEFQFGGKRHFKGMVSDISQRKAAEEALKEADRRKDEFLATLAHELRNPLAPVRNALQILRLESSAEDNVNWARSVIDRQIQQMTRLIDDLLDVTRISQGKMSLRREVVELSTIVQGAVETSRPHIQQDQHELSVALPQQPLYLDADLTRLAQVFSNLLNNAAKYTPAGGRIELSAQRQGSDVLISVKDNGIGIPADKLSTIFEMFSQAHPALERTESGLGIGLSLVKRLVEMHGGIIEARSDGPGRGAEFEVRLPLVLKVPEPTTNRASDERQAAPTSLRILIVDDNRDAADTLGRLLRIIGHDIRTAYDGDEGVQAANEFRPNVMLLDIGLPKLNGYDACRRIRQEPWGKQLVIIAVTGWGQDQDKQKAEEAGFDRHMVKPVEPKSLMKLFAELCVRGTAAESPTVGD